MTQLSKFKDLSNRKWLNLLIRSIKEPVIEGVKFPSFPEDQLQINTVGSANEHALREASLFYIEIKQFAAENYIRFNKNCRICDFGCGWARHYRFFLKDVPGENIVGTDIDEKFLQICCDTIPGGNFYQNNIHPPMEFPDNHFDLIYAFSVFSHLNQDIGIKWMNEFARILRPGGLVIVTTHSKGFIDFCASLRKEPQEFKWHQALAEKAFVNNTEAHNDYQNGRFLYASTGGGGPRTPDFYGEAVVSPAFVRTHWTEKFELVDYIDDPNRLSQALIVLKKKG